MYLIVGTGATSAAVLVVLALLAGRRKPARQGPWIAALILAGLPAAFLTPLAVAATVVSRQANWLVIGALGLCLAFVLALLRPRWAAWGFIASGLLLPILAWLADTLVEQPQESTIGAAQALGVYTWRALLTGGLLLWAVRPRAAKADSSAQPQAVVAPSHAAEESQPREAA
jgi:hypothetical protein